MPYDPNFPTSLTVATAAQMRAQLQSIVDLIGTIPQGPQGVPGPPGTSVAGAVVDGVSTVNPGDPATANASFDGANVHFSFGIPRGLDGTPGATGGQGPQGNQGIQGDVGPQGPMFTSFSVNSTTTLGPGQPASVQTFFDGASIRFNFGIPRGNDGLQGPIGPTGATGPAFTNFTVDSVNTLPPGNQATVTTTFDGTAVRFTFGIPQGQHDGTARPPRPARRSHRRPTRHRHRRHREQHQPPRHPRYPDQRPAYAERSAADAGQDGRVDRGAAAADSLS